MFVLLRFYCLYNVVCGVHIKLIETASHMPVDVSVYLMKIGKQIRKLLKL